MLFMFYMEAKERLRFLALMKLPKDFELCPNYDFMVIAWAGCQPNLTQKNCKYLSFIIYL